MTKRAWVYIARNCKVCHADISIYGIKGNLIEPYKHRLRQACNNPACQNKLKHPVHKLKEKLCKECNKLISFTWPRGVRKTKKQYNKLQFCSLGCKQTAMLEKRLPWKIPERNQPIDIFIHTQG